MATEITSVTCNHCGAPLQVPDSTRFVTCSHCGSQLEIHRSGNAVYTEVLQRIDERTEQMADDLNVIRRQNEIERLDREWQMRRETLLVRNKDGSTSTPGAIGAIVGSVFAGVIGCFVLSSAPSPMNLIGLVFILIGVVGGIMQVGKASEYRDAEAAYLRQRQALLGSHRDQQ
jgi:hypothetical protein